MDTHEDDDMTIIFEISPENIKHKVGTLTMEENDEETETTTDTTDEEKQREITKNFLAGKLSFSEYAAQMEDDDDDDDNQEETLETNKIPEEPSTTTTTTTSRVVATAAADKVKKDVKTRGTKKKIVKRPLPPTLKGLMGEANLRYARGDHKTAEKMCLEVIRQIPTVPDPFLTLAQMYEIDNPEKSLQFALIAAHLSPNDDGQWLRLAVLSENLSNLKQADTCYAKAISANPANISLHLKRIKFLETHGGDRRLVTKAKMRALTYMTSEQFEILLPMAQDLTHLYHKEGEIAKAMEALDAVFKKCPAHVTSELVNMMLELLLTLKNYKYCLELFVQHCNMDVEIEHDLFATTTTTTTTKVEEKMKIVSFNLPNSLPIDLHIKFIICLVHLRSFDLLQPLLEPLLCEEQEEGVEKNGDLYLDVAEALMAEQRHADALKLLVPLVKSKNFGMAAVWLRHAECLSACHLYEQAIDSYKKVMELAPMHLDMRYPLAELLISMDRRSEALAILEQDETCEELDAGLLFKRCKLLKELKFMSRYWSAGLLLLSRHCFTVRNRDEVEKLTCMQRPDRRGTLLKSLRAAKGEDVVDTTAMFIANTNNNTNTAAAAAANKNEPNVEEEFTLFKDLVESCMKRRRYDLMQRFTFTALSSKRFKVYKTDLELMAVFACIFNEDCFHGYNLVREMVQHHLDSKKCWNLYNLMIQRSDDGRHNRFLMRLLLRATVDPYINILHANNCLVAGTYKYALSEYISLYRIQEEEEEEEPLFALLIGVTFFQIASQKFSVKKDFLVVQGMGFMNIYKKLRGVDAAHEADYNIGRGYHQLGMLHIAAEHYKNVLKTKTALGDKSPHLFDLKREAAYNLHLIYKSSGAHDVAKMYLFKYIIV